MSQALNLKLKGLYTSANELSANPEGALAVADNIVIDYDSLAASRRGFDVLAFKFPNLTDRANRYEDFQATLIAHWGTNSLGYYVPGSGWTQYSGTYAFPDNTLAKPRFLQSNSNLYLTTSLGIKKLDTFSGTPSVAGGVKALDMQATATGSSGFLTNNTTLITTGNITSGSNAVASMASTAGLAIGQFVSGTGIQAGTTIAAVGTGAITLSLTATATTTGVSLTFSSGSQVAYRHVWGIIDANTNQILGSPSQRALAINVTGSSVNVSLTFTLPAAITNSYFYQIYRSAASVSSITEPSDEMQLVYQAAVTSSDVTAGTITVVDITPDSLKGATLYTSPSQGGIALANEPPPFAKDLCSYKNYVFYLNLKFPQRKQITILSVGGTGGVALNDVLTIGGVAFAAKASETIASGQFKLTTTGTPAQNITDTCNSLVKVINRYSSNTTFYAYYISGFNDLPGKILVQERGVGSAAFSFIFSGVGTAFSPTLPASGTSVLSTADVNKNGLAYSKNGQPEAVPLPNLTLVGNASSEGLRVIALRDYVFILKQDGIWKLSGTSEADFQIDPFDLTTHLLAPDSAVALSNEIWCLSDQGIVAISDTGTDVKSRAIETDINNLFGNALDVTKQQSFGIAYQTDRKYILFLPGASTDVYPTQAYVFNTFTNTWVRWTRRQSTGFVNPVDNRLYLGNADSNVTNVERKSFNYTDYVDEGFSVTYNGGTSDQTVFGLMSVAGINVGDLLYQSPTINSVIIAVDTLNSTVTVATIPGFNAFNAWFVYAAIGNVIEWQPQTNDNPGMVKQFQEISFLFKSTRFSQMIAKFRTELSQSFEAVMLVGASNGGWGLFPWGSVPWGGVNLAKAIRTYIPQSKQYAAQLTVRMEINSGFSNWKLQGVSVPLEEINTEVTK